MSSDADSEEIKNRLAMFENTIEQRKQIMAEVKDDDV